jgi:hypothetical protein
MVHLKSLLMVLTAALGTATGGTMINSFMSGSSTKATFFLTVDPSSQTIAQGASAHSTVTVISVNGFAGMVALSLFFPGATLPAVLSPSNVTVPVNGTARATLTITASTTTVVGNYTVAVMGIGSGQGKTRYSASIVTVRVVTDEDFTISSSPSALVNAAGSSSTTTILLSSVNGYSGNISLSVSVPFGYITATGGQNPVSLPASGLATSALQIITSSATLLGTYNLTVTGTSGSHVHTTVITLTVVISNPVVESLALTSYKFNSNTNVTLSLQNTGSSNVTLQSYSVMDTSGNAWTLPNWAGPTISHGSMVRANILISTSCNNCIYTGIVGLFTGFTAGHSYIVTVTTARNNQFSFTVTY